MDVSTLIRDPTQVHSALKEVKDTLVAVKPCKIYVPESYMGGPLGSVEDIIRIVGVYGIVVEGLYYGVSKALAIMQIEPSGTNVVTIDGLPYMEFSFEVGDTVVKNLNLIRTGTLVYRVYNEIIAKGKIPWYLSYIDLCFMFDTSIMHGNANLHGDSAILELIASTMARQHSDKAKLYRHSDMFNKDNLPVMIPLKYVAYGATNTTAKLLGAYFQEGVTSALVSPSDTVESIESLLRA